MPLPPVQIFACGQCNGLLCGECEDRWRREKGPSNATCPYCKGRDCLVRSRPIEGFRDRLPTQCRDCFATHTLATADDHREICPACMVTCDASCNALPGRCDESVRRDKPALINR